MYVGLFVTWCLGLVAVVSGLCLLDWLLYQTLENR
jgi:hypothetical protein